MKRKKNVLKKVIDCLEWVARGGRRLSTRELCELFVGVWLKIKFTLQSHVPVRWSRSIIGKMSGQASSANTRFRVILCGVGSHGEPSGWSAILCPL